MAKALVGGRNDDMARKCYRPIQSIHVTSRLCFLGQGNMGLTLKLATISVAIALLAACGGGGGGGSSTSSTAPPPTVYPDGLGVSGLATGTTVVGLDTSKSNFSESQPGVVLADNGKALVAWIAHAGGTVEDTLAWNQSDTRGNWGTAQPLALGTGVVGSWRHAITLRSNASGDAVLGWLVQETRDYVCGTPPCGTYTGTLNRAARFVDGVGWDATKYDASGGPAASDFSYPASWDLAMLDDRSFVSSVKTFASPSPIDAAYVMRQPISGSSELLLGPLSATFATSAFRSDGAGIQYWAAPGTTGGYDVKARFVSVTLGALGPFPVGTFQLCPATTRFSSSYSPFAAATSRTFHDTLAIIVTGETGGSCDTHNLKLVRIDSTGGISIRTTRVNAPNTIIPVPPVVVMDNKGDALAVWKEVPYNDANAPARLMWSASLNGGEWSTPAPVISNLTEIGWIRQDSLLALAMNENGEAIASLKTEDADTTLGPSVSIGKFSFSSGWSSWRRVANKLIISDPAVAINGAGNAIVAFTAIDTDRVNGKATQQWISSTTPTKVFALRL